jgi:sarcosine oxidase
MSSKTHDVAVIGAGVFGSWIARNLIRQGRTVALVDQYGAASNRASSGGESRIIRVGYGADEIYTIWALRSLDIWTEFFASRKVQLFIKSGMLWMARDGDSQTTATMHTLGRLGVAHEVLDRDELEKRWPQISFQEVNWGVYEPQSGALLARRAVHEVVADAIETGVEFSIGKIQKPRPSGKLDVLTLADGRAISAGEYVFACGPWLPGLFPEILDGRIVPTRQEVFFFGTPAGRREWKADTLPAWLEFEPHMYGLPDLENRGFKVAFDVHGPEIDPDNDERMTTSEILGKVRKYIRSRFPALADAPILETRVCQYENSSNGDFLIDRHPDLDNVWLVGAGSGHGFKHGPAIGEYVAGLIAGQFEFEERFSLKTKQLKRERSVF